MIRLVAFGERARSELARAILEAKRDDPLAPVTVVVPNNYIGLGVRRSLAAHVPLVNVRFMVFARLAELLGGAALAGRLRGPLVPWLAAEAVRTALRESPGVFKDVAEHPSTARRLARAAEELRELPNPALDRIAALGRRPADVVRIARRAWQLTSEYYDAADLFRSATAVMKAGSASVDEVGLMVLYLPRKVTPSSAAFFRAAAERGRAVAIIGQTADQDADDYADRLAMQLGDAPDVVDPPDEVPHATSIASLPDAEEEVRDAVREACRLANEEGIPFHRMAILYGQQEQYAQLVHEVLDVAGVPHNSPPIRKLAQSLAGRALLGLYRAAASGFRRDAVADWITSAPIVWQGETAPSHRWDEISRDAGVVRGKLQWQQRLEGWALEQDQYADENESAASYRRVEAARARELASFIGALIDEAGSSERLTGADHAKQARAWLDAFLPEWAVRFEGDAHATERETAAREDVVALLESIVAIQGVLPPEFGGRFDRGQFAILLEEALSKPAGHAGKLGEGIFTGPVSVAAEMEFDAVFILGMTEGSYPSGVSEDPLITEAERAEGGGLPLRSQRRMEERRAFLAALAGGGRVRLSMPRAAVRDQKTTLPSRWLLDSASALEGRPIYASELEALMRDSNRPAWFRVEYSFEAALREGTYASLQERDLASLHLTRQRPESHFLATHIAGFGDGIRARRARIRRGRHSEAIRKLDEWNGFVGAGSVALPSPERPISPTALETFAACPFRYYLGHVLRVGEVEKPEEADVIAAKDVGTIVHDTLEQFFDEMRSRPDGLAPWSADERARMRELALANCDSAEAKGLTGKPLAWQSQKARILRDLERFLDADEEFRAEHRCSFHKAELAFGTRALKANGETIAAVNYEVDEETVIAFRGRIDRIDRAADGGLIVTDYKTGGTYKYRPIERGDPLDAGKLLQLPVYALAVKEIAEGAPVTAQYWFVSEKETFKRFDVRLTEEVEETFREVVRTFVSTIREGYFPPVPGTEDWESWKNCKYCPYDTICPSSHRLELWNQWKEDSGIAEFVALVDKPEKTRGGR